MGLFDVSDFQDLSDYTGDCNAVIADGSDGQSNANETQVVLSCCFPLKVLSELSQRMLNKCLLTSGYSTVCAVEGHSIDFMELSEERHTVIEGGKLRSYLV